jgi:hypothetical protein
MLGHGLLALLAGVLFSVAGCASKNNGDRGASAASRGGDSTQLQGIWEQQPEEGRPATPRQRVVKEVKGEAETVTTYGPDGKVLHAQTARIRVGRSGRVPVYTFYDRRITAGPESGRTDAAPRSFVYRLRNDEFDEVWGLLPGQEQREVVVKRWRRANQ